MANPAAADDLLVDDAEISTGEEKVDPSMNGAVSESDEASNRKEEGDDDDCSKKEEAAEEKEELPKKTKVVDWPLRDIADPHPNDVLYGRGGEYTQEICGEERVNGSEGSYRRMILTIAVTEVLNTEYSPSNRSFPYNLLQAARIIIQATSGTEKWWRIEKCITFTANAWTSRW
jgi:hypothetical protein